MVAASCYKPPPIAERGASAGSEICHAQRELCFPDAARVLRNEVRVLRSREARRQRSVEERGSVLLRECAVRGAARKGKSALLRRQPCR